MALLKGVLRKRVVCVADVTALQSMEVEQATRQRWRRLLYTPILRVLEALLVRSADLVLTVNDRLGELLPQRSARARIRTLRDTADAELATIPATDRAALGVPEHAVAVAFVGSLVYSRLEPIFAAWRELCRRQRSLRFTWSSSVTGPTCGATRGGPPTTAGSWRTRLLSRAAPAPRGDRGGGRLRHRLQRVLVRGGLPRQALRVHGAGQADRGGGQATARRGARGRPRCVLLRDAG